MLSFALLSAHAADPTPARHRELRTLPPAAIPTETMRRVSAGEIATGVDAVSGVRRAWGLGVVDVDIDAYWRAINDNRSKVAYSDLDHVEVLSGTPCGPQRVVFQYLDIALVSDRWWVVEQRTNAALWGATAGAVRELSWHSVSDPHEPLSDTAAAWARKGVPVRTEGSWTLTALPGGRTLVEYVATSDAGGMVPASVLARFAARSVAHTITSMGDLAQSGPRCP